MYENWSDDELKKEQKRLWIQLVKNGLAIIELFGLVVLIYLAARNEMWWLICGGAVFIVILVFIHALCTVAARADDQMGIR